MQIAGLSPHYTTHPIFPNLFTAMIVASLIAIGLNFVFSMLRKKTMDMAKMNKVMKETNEWRKQYTDAIKKQDKARVAELKKKQAYVNKMAMEMQQQQMRPMLIYMAPSFMLWIFVFPAIFGETVALSHIEIPWIMCTSEKVHMDNPIYNNGDPKGPCTVPGEVYLCGWFVITNFAFSGIVSKITKISMPSIT